jgi:hypothetical protein
LLFLNLVHLLQKALEGSLPFDAGFLLNLCHHIFDRLWLECLQGHGGVNADDLREFNGAGFAANIARPPEGFGARASGPSRRIIGNRSA